MPKDNYKTYKKGVKKLGGKVVASKKEYKTIQERVQKKYGRSNKTLRTASIERALAKAGLTPAEIKRLRGN